MGRTIGVIVVGLIIGAIVGIILFEDRGPGIELEKLALMILGAGIALFVDTFRRQDG